MAETANPQKLTFHGERMTWVSPASLEELIQLKAEHPQAPLVMGNTNIGQQGTNSATYWQQEAHVESQHAHLVLSLC